MAKIKSKSRRAPGQILLMGKALIFCAGDRAKYGQLNLRIQKIGDFVGNGLACSPAVHIETVRQD